MLEAIQQIQEYVGTMALDAFKADRRTVDAVIRQFEVMGEAACHVPEEVQTKYTGVPWSRIRGMRHLLAHEYFGVNEEIIWKTATYDIAPVAIGLRKVLEAGTGD
jgi:uncharacterized protein with HEPN domain